MPPAFPSAVNDARTPPAPTPGPRHRGINHLPCALRYCAPMADLGTQLTAIITPFDEAGNVDEDAYVRVLRHVCEHGSDGVVVAGSTGGGSTPTDEEDPKLIELTVAQRPGGKTGIARTGPDDTRHPREMTQEAAQLGGHAIPS